MEEAIQQMEKNVSASFGYVKKDVLMLNDSYTSLQEAVTQLAKSYEVLGDELKKLRKDLDATVKKTQTTVITKKAPKKVVAKKKAKKVAPKKVAKKVATKKVSKKTAKKVTVKKTTSTPKKVKKRDDLTVIEGIGPAIKRLLTKEKITTFKELADASVVDLRKMIENAGPRFRMHDPTSWPRQAKLASEGRVAELAKLQKELKGGVKPRTTKKTTTTKTKNSSEPTVKKVVEKTTVYE
jgi:predicted flap endonuclease-1-like 5' DNA nuclease